MTQLLDNAPYGVRNEVLLWNELYELTCHHLRGCPAYARVWPAGVEACSIQELPFLHTGVFKHVEFRTAAPGIQHERTLKSSATTNANSSRIPLDAQSSQLQSRSTAAILKDFLGGGVRPLLILDSSRSLLARGELSARVAAALCLQPLATEVFFVLNNANDAASVNWERVRCGLESQDEVLVYGFTWMLWLAWARSVKPDPIRTLLATRRINFVHSGGWKKLEEMKVSRAEFDAALLQGVASGSRVLDYYGLVEQVGIIFPLCEAGSRHVPAWAAVLVRDPFTFHVVVDGEPGLLQFANPLARGGPYHNVLTEDMGRILPGPCGCGRSGLRFELFGRLAKAEMRGCANV